MAKSAMVKQVEYNPRVGLSSILPQNHIKISKEKKNRNLMAMIDYQKS